MQRPENPLHHWLMPSLDDKPAIPDDTGPIQWLESIAPDKLLLASQPPEPLGVRRLSVVYLRHGVVHPLANLNWGTDLRFLQADRGRAVVFEPHPDRFGRITLHAIPAHPPAAAAPDPETVDREFKPQALVWKLSDKMKEPRKGHIHKTIHLRDDLYLLQATRTNRRCSGCCGCCCGRPENTSLYRWNTETGRGNHLDIEPGRELLGRIDPDCAALWAAAPGQLEIWRVVEGHPQQLYRIACNVPPQIHSMLGFWHEDRARALLVLREPDRLTFRPGNNPEQVILAVDGLRAPRIDKMQVCDGHLLQTWEEGDIHFAVIRSLVRPVAYHGVQWPEICYQRVPLPPSSGRMWLLPGGRVVQLQGRTLHMHTLERGALDVFHGHLRVNLFAQSRILADHVLHDCHLSGLTYDQFQTLTEERHGISQAEFDALADSAALLNRIQQDFPSLRIESLLEEPRAQLEGRAKADLSQLIRDAQANPLYLDGIVNLPTHGHSGDDFCIMTRDPFHGLGEGPFNGFDDQQFVDALLQSYGLGNAPGPGRRDRRTLMGRRLEDLIQMSKADLSADLHARCSSYYANPACLPLHCFGIEFDNFRKLTEEHYHGLERAEFDVMDDDAFRAHLRLDLDEASLEQLFNRPLAQVNLMTKAQMSASLHKRRPLLELSTPVRPRLCGLTRDAFQALTRDGGHGLPQPPPQGYLQFVRALFQQYPDLNWEQFLGISRQKLQYLPRIELSGLIKSKRLSNASNADPEQLCGLTPAQFRSLTESPYHGFKERDFVRWSHLTLLTRIEETFPQLDLQRLLGPNADTWDAHSRDKLSARICGQRLAWQPCAHQVCGLDHFAFDALTLEDHGLPRHGAPVDTTANLLVSLRRQYPNLDWQELLGDPPAQLGGEDVGRLRARIRRERYRLQIAGTSEETYGINPADFAQLAQPNHGLRGVDAMNTAELLAALEARSPGYNQQAFFSFLLDELEAADKTLVTRLIRFKLGQNLPHIAPLCGLTAAQSEALREPLHGMEQRVYDGLTTSRLLTWIRGQYPSLNEQELFCLSAAERANLDVPLLRDLLRIKRPRRQIDPALLPLFLRESGFPLNASIDPSYTAGTPTQAHTAIFNQLFQQHREGTFLALFEHLTSHPEHISLAVVQNMCHNVRSTRQLTMTYLLALAEVKQAQHTGLRRKLKVLRRQLKWTFYKAADVQTIRTPEDLARYSSILRSARRHHILNEGEGDTLTAVAYRSLVYADPRYADVIHRLDRHDRQIADLRIDVTRVQDELTGLKEKLARDKRNEAILSVFKALAGVFGRSLIDLIDGVAGAMSAIDLMEKVLTEPFSFIEPILDRLPPEVGETLGIFEGVISDQVEEKMEDTILGVLGWDEEEPGGDAPMAVGDNLDLPADPEEAWFVLNRGYLDQRGLRDREINVVRQ